ncbi:hypothetical protein [Engelhardtia mirabilis]|uniref:Uncharacterized protein n=1 Tax=Engelhardtia mirabilis TaxID=2528011 RepID=A0A518BP26_9BACT|nr:hypothetical protein Pla133_38350 [Planctomycetes bacterium Pla133]QDV03059.1 hypothetical protein Pla86_38340 [Planctomycetes bacterium Pla86]
MSQPNLFLLQTAEPAAIQRATLELSEACKHERPGPRRARLSEVAEGLFVLEFDRPLAGSQAVRLIGQLFDHAEIDEVVAWIEGAGGVCYELRPELARLDDGATRFLHGSSAAGEGVEVYIPECWMRPASSAPPYQPAPSAVGDGRTVLEWDVSFDDELSPRLDLTHAAGETWPLG